MTPNRQVLGIRYLVGRDDPGSQRAASVHALAFEPLAAVAPLDVPGRNVVGERIAEDVIHGLSGRYAPPGAAYHDRELGLVVHLLGEVRVEGNVVVGPDHRRRRFVEEGGVLGQLLLLVIAPS